MITEDQVSANRTEILLVEDDPGHAALVRQAFTKARVNLPIRHFSDGSEVIEFLKEYASSDIEAGMSLVVLLDMRMPRVNGDEVLKFIKSDERLRSIPVIVLSTTDDPAEIDRCYALGCNEYVTKPIRFEAFRAVVERLGRFIQVIRTPRLT